MNRRIGNLFIVLAVGLLALIGMTTYWQVWARSSLEARQANVRLVYRDLAIDRGAIVSSDGVTLAESKPGTLDGRTVYYRHYPTAGLAAQLVGYSSLLAGRAGLERSLDPELTGSTGDLAGVVNSFDRMKGDTVRGDQVVLRLNAAAQKVAMEQLTSLGVRGSVVVLDPSSGGILVMASTPTYDPNTGLEKALSDPGSPLLNRATQGLYPPGSTFKVVTAASALDAGVVTPDTKFPGPACINSGGQPLCNYHGHAYGPHNFGYALIHSINTTFAKVGAELGQDKLEATMRGFGFFSRFPWDYPPEQTLPSGIFNRSGNMISANAPIDVPRVAIGQERLLATPLQMAEVAAAVANGGQIIQPEPVQEVRAPDGSVVRRPSPVYLGRAMTTETAATLRGLMKQVVDEGTGGAAAVAGLDVAGKTGTAETGRAGKNDAWFIGFAPAEASRYAFAVLVEDVAGTGGDVAAPIVAAVLRALTALTT
ncbi:MAG: penicillin-binding transpeptidase domain-containing protein [Thermoleophilia bacterium]